MKQTNKTIIILTIITIAIISIIFITQNQETPKINPNQTTQNTTLTQPHIQKIPYINAISYFECSNDKTKAIEKICTGENSSNCKGAILTAYISYLYKTNQNKNNDELITISQSIDPKMSKETITNFLNDFLINKKDNSQLPDDIRLWLTPDEDSIIAKEDEEIKPYFIALKVFKYANQIDDCKNIVTHDPETGEYYQARIDLIIDACELSFSYKNLTYCEQFKNI